MKVLGLISSPTDPSSRARILQYKQSLADKNIFLTARYFWPHSYADPKPWAFRIHKMTGINPWRFSWLQKSLSRSPLLVQQYNYDLIWQNRLVIPHQSFYERKFKKPIVFDLDDAIWLHDGEQKVAEVMKRSALVFAGNEYLAAYANQHNANTFLIPSVIDTDILFPTNQNHDFTIGWMGSVSNLKYLEMARPAILEFLEKNTDTRFIVVSSNKPPGFSFDTKRIIFRQWSAEKENEHINEFSIGIMPLEDTEFTRGKCSYKMLQYMSCGKPVVVSPVGSNSKILSEETVGIAATNKNEWLDAFQFLKNDISFYQQCSMNGRKLVEENYSIKYISPVIAGHFTALLQPA